MTHTEFIIGGSVVGVLAGLFLFDRLIGWAETHGSRSYDDPRYVPGS